MSNAGTAKIKRTRGESGEPLPKPVPKEARTRGRPELFEQSWVTRACELAKTGATDVEIARELGCSVATFYATAAAHPDFSEAVTRGKEAADRRMVQSLYRRGMGYEYETDKVFSNGLKVRVIEHVPADPGSIMNWLKNRDPDRWRDRTQTEIVVPVPDDNPETLDQRQLALAALALISEAAYTTAPATTTIEASPNPEEGDDNGEEDPDIEPAQEAVGRPKAGRRTASRNGRSRGQEVRDPDFDFD